MENGPPRRLRRCVGENIRLRPAPPRDANSGPAARSTLDESPAGRPIDTEVGIVEPHRRELGLMVGWRIATSVLRRPANVRAGGLGGTPKRPPEEARHCRRGPEADASLASPAVSWKRPAAGGRRRSSEVGKCGFARADSIKKASVVTMSTVGSSASRRSTASSRPGR